jgi:GNAT superfamily N-acetyltransferase
MARRAIGSDAGAIARIHAASWRATYAGLLPDRYLASLDEVALAERWHRRMLADRRGDLWVIDDGCGETVGFSQIGPCRDPVLAGFSGEVYMLYLRPDRIGCGLGSVLWRRASAELAARGHRWIVVSVVRSNRAARSFYMHMGLRPDGAVRRDRFDGVAVEVERFAGVLAPVVDFDALMRATTR